jgi:hypothetical protein
MATDHRSNPPPHSKPSAAEKTHFYLSLSYRYGGSEELKKPMD